MKIKNSLVVIILLLSTIISCKKNETSANTDNRIVYVSGYIVTPSSPISNSTTGAYWKNGVLTTIPNTSLIQSIITSGNDLYILGTNGYWKNGIFTNLGTNSTLNSVCVSNGDVYIAGSQIINDTAFATYWKNGIPEILSSETDTSYYGNTGIYVSDFCYSVANSIFVSGNDVYVAGYVNIFSDQVTYWKNGKAIYFTNPGASYSRANSIFVSGNDVYVVGWLSGYGDSHATFWKNGASTYLSSNGGEASSVFVAEDTVYIAGYINNSGTYNATYWKNGVQTILSNGSIASGITISGSDIYICGKNDNNDAIYWKNDVAHILGLGATTSISIGN
ncbi:MAG TPA: hypothetical protein VIJ95_18860 [Hanamia sp.]